MDLKQYLHEKALEIEKALKTYIPSLPAEAERLGEAMRYSLFAGGKRLRPILTLASAEVVGGNPQVAMPAACAIEFIHTYSLIHDDLPVMDDDDWRRGKPTSHKVFGEAQALLAGDALLTHAFTILAASYKLDSVKPEKVLKVVLEIASAAGPEGMVGGQSADIEQEGAIKAQAAPSVLKYIHTHKTGSLIMASVRAGAILGGATLKQLKLLTTYGKKLGLAFQICDDILDATGDPKLLGKPVKTDATHKKLTYVTVHGLQEAKNAARRLDFEAVESLTEFNELADPLRAIAHYAIQRRK